MSLSRLNSFLHNNLWARLPRRWRREALFQTSALAAPRPTPKAKPGEPIVIVGALRTSSGLGGSARLCHDALKATGRPVYGIDLSAALMQPLDYPDFAFADGRAILGPATIILHVNSPLIPLAMWRLSRRLVRKKFIVGFWAWELPHVPSDWRFGIPFVHEIWVPSEFTAAALRPISAGRPVRVVPYPVSLHPTMVAARLRSADRPFKVLTIFNMASSFERKNPCATIRAFRLAFGDDPMTQLVIKTSHAFSFPEGLTRMKEAIGTADNISIINKPLSANGIDALYADTDVFISLHRAEGFGLTIAEAMLRGLPVVATGWSGNIDFMGTDTGMPIPYELVPAEDPQDTYNYPQQSWADADVAAAANALRKLRDNPALAASLGRQASEFIATTLSAESYDKTVRDLLGI